MPAQIINYLIIAPRNQIDFCLEYTYLKNIFHFFNITKAGAFELDLVEFIWNIFTDMKRIREQYHRRYTKKQFPI